MSNKRRLVRAAPWEEASSKLNIDNHIELNFVD